VFSTSDPHLTRDKGTSSYSIIPEINVTTPGVCKLLSEINPNKAPGQDNIPAQVLKSVSEEL